MFETRQPELRDLFGWQFAENEDDYFMTPERAAPRPPPAAMTAEYVVSPPKLVATSEQGCQTPYWWPTFEVVGAAPEAAPRRAPERKAVVDAGTTPDNPLFRPSNVQCNPIRLNVCAPRSPCAGAEAIEKEPRAASIAWFEHAPSEPNKSEVLLFALLVLSSGKTVSELDEWAKKVLVEERPHETDAVYKLPESPEWRAYEHESIRRRQPLDDRRCRPVEPFECRVHCEGADVGSLAQPSAHALRTTWRADGEDRHRLDNTRQLFERAKRVHRTSRGAPRLLDVVRRQHRMREIPSSKLQFQLTASAHRLGLCSRRIS